MVGDLAARRRKVRGMRESGLKIEDIAKALGVSTRTVIRDSWPEDTPNNDRSRGKVTQMHWATILSDKITCGEGVIVSMPVVPESWGDPDYETLRFCSLGDALKAVQGAGVDSFIITTDDEDGEGAKEESKAEIKELFSRALPRVPFWKTRGFRAQRKIERHRSGISSLNGLFAPSEKEVAAVKSKFPSPPTHTNQNPETCSYCGESFADFTALAAHLSTCAAYIHRRVTIDRI